MHGRVVNLYLRVITAVPLPLLDSTCSLHVKNNIYSNVQLASFKVFEAQHHLVSTSGAQICMKEYSRDKYYKNSHSATVKY